VTIPASTPRTRPADPAAYAASAWAFAFAALSFYWAAGGTAGAGTVSPTAKEMAQRRVPWFVAVLWLTGILKLGAGLLALALVRPWGRLLPRWLLRGSAWATGALLIFYGGTGLARSVPVLTGAVTVPEPVDRTVLRWHVFLWQPYWLAGGILFAAAARNRQP
jgi:hypothetical protein